MSYETTSGGPTGPLPQTPPPGVPQQPQQAGPQTQQMQYPPQQGYAPYGGEGYGQRNGHDVAEQARRYVHTPEFRRKERLYPLLDRAERWIEKHLPELLRAVR